MTQVSEAPARTRAQIAEKTFRQDPWWRQPAIVVTDSDTDQVVSGHPGRDFPFRQVWSHEAAVLDALRDRERGWLT